MSRKPIQFIACGAVAFALSSCSSGNPAVMKEIPADQWTQQVTALCAANGEKIGANFAAMSEPPTPGQQEVAYETVISESYKIVGDAFIIGAPEGKSQQVFDALVELQKATADTQAKGQEAFFASDADPWKHGAQVLADLGATSCAHPK